MPRYENHRYALSSTNVLETLNNLSDTFICMELHEKIREERQRRGWSQAELGKKVGISQPAVKKIEAGSTVRSRFIGEIASVLGLDVESSIVGMSPPPGATRDDEGQMVGRSSQASRARKPDPVFLGSQDLPVFAAVEGGPGEMNVSNEPIDMVPRPWFLSRVREAYAVVVTGESMLPVYDPGDMVLVNPKLPPMKGKDAIFVADEQHGGFNATIKRFVSSTESNWTVRQFNPPAGQDAEFKLDRKRWARALRVVGRYTG